MPISGVAPTSDARDSADFKSTASPSPRRIRFDGLDRKRRHGRRRGQGGSRSCRSAHEIENSTGESRKERIDDFQRFGTEIETTNSHGADGPTR